MEIEEKRRVGFMDEWRGFAILLMVVYHGLYDLHVLFGVNFPFFTSPFFAAMRTFIAASFIVISGISCHYSRNNRKRGLICFGFGMVMTAGTALLIPSQLIVFGILHFMGISMILYSLFERPLAKLSPLMGIGIFLFCFALTYRLYRGYIGIQGFFQIPLPDFLYQTNWLSPLGFYSSSFSSADYYPLMPWFFLFAAGSYLGIPLQKNLFPDFFYRTRFPWLSKIGQHTILVYLFHQPILYGLLWLFFH